VTAITHFYLQGWAIGAAESAFSGMTITLANFHAPSGCRLMTRDTFPRIAGALTTQR
jgi:hypothetical protein